MSDININSPELDYISKINNHSSVIYRSITPQGSSSITLGTTSGVVGPVEFIMPPSVFNPSKSRLNFSVNLGAAVSGGTGVTNIIRWVNGNLGSILNRVVLYDSATSAIICDVSNFDKWTNMIAPAGESLDKYLGKASPAQAVLPSVTEATAQAFPLDNLTRSNVATAANFVGVTTGTLAGSDFTGRRLWYISPTTTNDGTTCYLNISFLFEDIFKFTALSLNKNIYLPSNTVLQCYFNSNDSFQFNSALAGDATVVNSVAVGATVSRLQVQLANESNINLIAQTIKMVMEEGVTLPVAYPTVTRQTFSATTAPSYQLQLTAGYGKRILFLATSPFGLAAGGTNAATTINYSQWHSAPRSSLFQYQTTLNSVPIKTPAGFDCTKGDDWTVGNSHYLEKSPTQSLQYYINQDWIHIDSFFGEKPLSDVDQTMVDGIDVSTQSQTFGFQATTSNIAHTWITAIVGQKMLSLTSQGAIMS
jgi:hypothetical protein